LKKIGILALQGAVLPHIEKLAKLGADAIEVRYPEDLEKISGIILPGGESSTMLHLIELNQLWNPLTQFFQNKPAWGICAGSILLAKKVSHPVQKSFGVVDIEVERNAYGRQNESFIEPLSPTSHWFNANPFEGIFIRAPKIKSLSSQVKPLFMHEKEVVMAEQEMHLVSTFHPELTESTLLHEYFLKKCNHG
jgi:5'-phosphate synthase pdxT subunit